MDGQTARINTGDPEPGETDLSRIALAAGYDTGQICGNWYAMPIRGPGQPVGPAGTPGELAAMITAEAAGAIR